MKIPQYGDLTNSTCREKYIKNQYSEFWSYINNNYPSDLKWTEKLYWYYHNLTSHPVCETCGKPTNFINLNNGYNRFCCIKCSRLSDDVKEKSRKTCLQKYGVENPIQSEIIKNKIKLTNIKKYGVENPFQSDVVKDNIKQTNLKKYGVEYYSQTDAYKEKTKLTNLKKYGVEYSFQSEVVKANIKQTNLKKYGTEHYTQIDAYKEKTKLTNLERYGVEYPMQSDVVKQKVYNTKKRNHTFNVSKVEDQFAAWLDNNNINYIKQYKSDKYPFNCDFYFPDRDLYLEIQGHWSHGGHPFDPLNDIKKLNEWKSKGNDFYNLAIDVWTVRDPMKRKLARENNLNWCEVFTDNLNDLIKQFESPLKKSF